MSFECIHRALKDRDGSREKSLIDLGFKQCDDLSYILGNVTILWEDIVSDNNLEWAYKMSVAFNQSLINRNE